jgi:two-component system, chemotaxis family, protein-glutamate methylesterase/glutaminase
VTAADRIVEAADIGRALCDLIEEPIHVEPTTPAPIPSDRDVDGLDLVEADPADVADLLIGPPTALTCPECGGTLWEQDDGGVVRYACHVGHAYSLVSLMEAQGSSLEMTLWSAVRALEERADLHRRLSRRASPSRAEVYEERAQEADRHARELRAMLSMTGRLAAPAPDET